MKQVFDLYALTQKIQHRRIAILTKIIHEAPRPNYTSRQPHFQNLTTSIAVCTLWYLFDTKPLAPKNALMELLASERYSYGLGCPAVIMHPRLITVRMIASSPKGLLIIFPLLFEVPRSIPHTDSLYVKVLSIVASVDSMLRLQSEKSKATCGEGLEVFPTQQGQANLGRIRQGLLPAALSAWPADTPSYLSESNPAPISAHSSSYAPLLTLSTT